MAAAIRLRAWNKKSRAWIKLHNGQIATPEEVREFCKGQIAH
jgi:hypothetical protein